MCRGRGRLLISSRRIAVLPRFQSVAGNSGSPVTERKNNRWSQFCVTSSSRQNTKSHRAELGPDFVIMDPVPRDQLPSSPRQIRRDVNRFIVTECSTRRDSAMTYQYVMADWSRGTDLPSRGTGSVATVCPTRRTGPPRPVPRDKHLQPVMADHPGPLRRNTRKLTDDASSRRIDPSRLIRGEERRRRRILEIRSYLGYAALF